MAATGRTGLASWRGRARAGLASDDSNRRSPVRRALFALCLGCLVPCATTERAAGQQESTSLASELPTVAGNQDRDTHPLAATLKWVKEEIAFLERNVGDYSATLFSRERVEGTLGDYETVALKIRHHPFSVYACTLTPQNRKGNEAIYVEGKYDSKLMVHAASGAAAIFGMISLDPTSSIALRGRRHPITEIGVLNICRGVQQYVESDLQYPESQVRMLRNAKVEGRLCSFIEIRHPVRRPYFKFHLLRLFVDEELKIPIRYEQHDWPAEVGGPPLLVEEYTYLQVKLNNGFTDGDFDPSNPQYGFP
jgi:hypothetical protein